MSNTPDSTILGKMTSRAAGKRQIKPTAVLYATMHQEHSSDEEDEDFDVKMVTDERSTASDSESESDSDEDEEEEEDEDEEEEEKKEIEEKIDEKLAKICGVCVNRRENEDDWMQCDKCGINVHESCYGGVFLEDSDDEGSSNTTTNWFCEPCAAGLDAPPFCEFCPSRYGAFKKSDVGGRWVHLVCGLFTPGAAFSAIDALTGISWQEGGNSMFGKKSCSACKDRIEARFGIPIRCESGMCKEFMHVTCAQRLGLLVDETDDQTEESASIMRYFFCKKHTHNENAKKMHRNWLVWEKLENRRFTINRRRPGLKENEETHRKMMKAKLEKCFENLIDVNINIPTSAIEKSRRARMLNTSAEFFDRFESKAEDAGISRQEFRAPFLDIKSTNMSVIPVGFSKEYLDYMLLRDTTLIPEEEEKLKNAREKLAAAKELNQKLSKSATVAENIATNEDAIDAKMKIFEEFYNVVKSFGTDNEEIASFLNDSMEKKEVSEKNEPKMVKSKKVEDVEVKCCSVCDKNTDQHKMTKCDECAKSYHIGCLTPPLTRLPKRNKCGWICHECNESSESEEIDIDCSELSSRASRSRRPPARHSTYMEH